MSEIQRKKCTLRFLPDLENLYDEIKRVKSIIGEIDRDVEGFNNEVRFRLLSKRSKLLKLFFDGLNFFAVEGEFQPATNTQDLIVKCKFSERYFEFISTIRTRETDR